MADASQPITPPIPDSNGNGILDGADICAQLKREEEKGSERTPNERAHGVLETIGTREVSAEIRRVAIEARGRYTGEELDQAGNFIATELKKAVDQITAKLATVPNLREAMDAEVNRIAQQEHLTAEQVAIIRADQRNTVDFAQTFNATFPKGIAIDRKDVLEILGHFGGVIAPTGLPKPDNAGKGNAI